MKLHGRVLVWLLVVSGAQAGAAGAPSGPKPPPPPPALEPPPPGIAQRFAGELAKVSDLELSGLQRALGIRPPAPERLAFDVRRARYFDRVVGALKLTAEEKRMLTATGVVGV